LTLIAQVAGSMQWWAVTQHRLINAIITTGCCWWKCG